MYRAFILLLLACLFHACIESGRDAEKPFAGFFDFRAEITRLQKTKPAVEKTIISGTDSVTYTANIDWENEFAIFLACDINRPRYRDLYAFSSSDSGHYSLLHFAALDSALPVRKVVQTIAGKQCQKIIINRMQRNPLSSTHAILTYVPHRYYSIRIKQTSLSNEEIEIVVTGRFIEHSQIWRGVLDIGEEKLPFNFTWQPNDPEDAIVLINGQERIEVNDIRNRGDSIEIHLPTFDTEIRGVYSDTAIYGYWTDHTREGDYRLPFAAHRGQSHRFAQNNCTEYQNFSGRWEAMFSKGMQGEYKAIGIFKQDGNLVRGTFLTETGDYRYLEGTACGNELSLSSFDGNHVFLFKASCDSAGKLSGNFWSGKHWKEPWSAVRNEGAALSNPYSLTTITNASQKLDFQFPDTDGNLVSLSDPIFKNKALIVEIMASWCSNCKDETEYLADLYDKYKHSGLEIVALAYERHSNFKKAAQCVLKHKNSLGAKYRFLIAGPADKQKASRDFPMLNGIISFPTTIFLDKKGVLRRIYTGFYGPGTGAYYSKFKQETDSLVQKLVSE